jgi:hypothetical protein
MRLYTSEEEERIALQTSVRDWTQSKLLEPSQRARLEPELRTDLRRANTALRISLAVFTLLIAVASVAFVVLALGLKSSRSVEIAVEGAAAILYLGLAEGLVRLLRLYRFGVEETLAVLGVVAFGLTVSSVFHEPVATVAGLLGAAAGGLWIYTRFGFVYGAMGSVMCVAAIPFQVTLPYATTRALAAAAFAVACAIAHLMQRDAECEIRRADYADIRAAAWAGLNLVLNLQLTIGEPPVGRAFYWCTYALTWMLPATGLWVAIRDKDRALLGVNLITALITLLTHKPYLHWARHSWDPMIFGIMLMSAALGIRRWLSTGPGGARNGYTPERLLVSDTKAAQVLGTVALGVQTVGVSMGYAPHAGARPPGGFEGGQSGGGGGGAAY